MEENSAGLIERIERLERVVEGLLARDPHAAAALAEGRRVSAQETDGPAASAPAAPSTPSPAAGAPARPAPKSKPMTATRPARSATPELQSWLRMVGIALLLFGVAFLFKYSQDESDVLRLARVAIGIALGIGLVSVGHALLGRDRPFAQILTGGGIAVWYMSGYAAYQLFSLVPAPPAFLFMAAVTVAAYTISLRQNSLPLTIVATIGGLATPFLLYSAERGVAGTAAYIAIVASTAVVIHMRRTWWPLMICAAVGSFFAVLATSGHYLRADSPDSERWILQAALLFLMVLFAVTFALIYARDARVLGPVPKLDDRLIIVGILPVATVYLTNVIWTMTVTQMGQLCVAFALLYGGASLLTYGRSQLQRLGSTHFVVATGMAAFGALTLLHGGMQQLAIATEALALRLMWRYARVSVADAISHALFGVAGLLVIRDITSNGTPALPVFNQVGITTLWSLAAGAMCALWLPRAKGSPRPVYFYTAHALVLGWVLREFAGVHNGQAIITIVWGTYGASLMVAGLRRTNRAMRNVGLLTLLAVVVKMFMVDLVSVPAVWRVLLFLGFGGMFLALSYWFLTLDRGAQVAGRSPADAQRGASGSGR